MLRLCYQALWGDGAIKRKEEARQIMRSRKRLSTFADGSSHNGSNCIWSHVISAFALAVIASALVACSSGFAGKHAIPSGGNQVEKTGKALLIGDQAETAGYGLYSYVLFESPPNAETRPIYLAVISSCLREIPDLAGLETKYPNKKKLNAMYIPVTGDSTDSKSPQKTEEILQHYNYERAQAILNRLPTVQKNGGPYMLSSLEPVSSNGSLSVSLYQDLSVVRLASNQVDQPKMAYEWVLDFVDRVSTPQSTAWDRTTLGNFSDEVREARQPAFERYNVRTDQVDLKTYIVFPIPDSKVE